MSAQNKFIAARTSLILEQPFFGSLALRLKVQADPACKTAWVDGRTLGFNPAFIDSLNHDQTVALVAHEVMHVALGHPWRRGGRAMKPWNIACDKAINTELRTAGFTLPPDAYYAEGEEVGKSAEWIHGHTTQPEPQPQPEPEPEEEQEEEQEEQEEQEESSDPDNSGESNSDDDGDGDSDSDGNGEGESDDDGESSDAGDGNGDGADDPLGEVRDAPAGPDADGDPAPTEQDWKEAVATAAALAKSQGVLPAGLARAVADALKPRVDVRSLVLRFMQERTASDYAWTRPNSRYAAHGLYLPALQGNRLGHVAVMVDTSGSIDHVALASARAIVQEVLDECDPEGVALYFADAQVCHVQRLERGETLTWEPKGGGGTNFCPALEAIEQDENQPVCCICITDLEGTFPTVAPEVPVLWLATKERDWSGRPLVAPFGETVHVGD